MKLDREALTRAAAAALAIHGVALLLIAVPSWVDDPEIDLNWLMMIPVGILLFPGVVLTFVVSRAFVNLGGNAVIPFSMAFYVALFYWLLRRRERGGKAGRR